MSEDFLIHFKTVIIKVDGGWAAAILMGNDIFQDKHVCATEEQAQKRTRWLNDRFIRKAEHVLRARGMTMVTNSKQT